MIGPTPICCECKHFNRSMDRTKHSCRAFPEAIPYDIFYTREFIHTVPYPNPQNPLDKGIRFEPLEVKED